MNNTRIDWADSTWNPISGCLNICPYCYARKIANRFKGYDKNGIEKTIVLKDNYGLGFELDTPLLKLNGNAEYQTAPYPYDFVPTLHRYRLDEPARKTKPRNIFVGSMCDLFGEWVPENWIQDVFAACEAAPQHRYLFLTKNPKRYCDLSDTKALPASDNYWYGMSLTDAKSHSMINYSIHYAGKPVPVHRNTFASIEPLLENGFNRIIAYYGYAFKWIIVGAETGKRKEKVIPERKWIEDIAIECKAQEIPLFMKSSLRDLMGDDFIQQYPWEVK